MRPRVTVIAADPVDPVSMGNKLLKKIIEKIGAETKPVLETIDETMKENSASAGNAVEEEEEEAPEAKKMRMMDMEVEPTPIESKE